MAELKSKSILLFLAITGLAGTAISTRTMEMINMSPEFYVNYRMDNTIILSFLIVFSLILPLALGGIAWLFARNRYTGTLSMLLFVMLAAATLSGIMRELPDPAGGTTILLLSAALGIAGWYAFLRWDVVRVFVAATALILPITFYNSANSANLSFANFIDAAHIQDQQASKQSRSALPNVVFLVFDELPLTTLLDPTGQIDKQRFPNLHELAEQSYWFRQTSTVSCNTPTAVPAILSGKLFGKPSPKSPPPVYENYQQNLFSLLGKTHDVRAWESLTQLCPSTVCEDSASASLVLGHFSEHLMVAWLHATLPSALELWLPGLDSYWMDAAAIQTVRPKNAHQKLYSVRVQHYWDFIGSIVSQEEPWLRFGHFLLPHTPFELLPDGTAYYKGGTTYAIDGKSWDNQSVHIAQSYFRHILQTMYTDRLVGALVKRLQDIGEYNNTAIVIASDHGVSFAPGDTRRRSNNINYANLIGIPLIFKTAGQSSGKVIDIPVQTIDILPTLLGTMNHNFGNLEFDGRNLFADGMVPISERLHYCSKGRYDRFPNSLLPELIKQVLVKVKMFGDRDDATLEMNFSSKPEWIGRTVDEIGIVKPSGRVAKLSGLKPKDTRKSHYAPVHLNGTIVGSDPVGSDDILIVATLNERVASVMPTVRHKTSHRIISSILQPLYLRDGQNVIKLFAVDRKAQRPVVLLELNIRDAATKSETGSIIFER